MQISRSDVYDAAPEDTTSNRAPLALPIAA